MFASDQNNNDHNDNGKTSLIRQLIGEELKFEPELREAERQQRRQRHLQSSWLSELSRHEQQLAAALETERLAGLLSNQISLQQLLLEQQHHFESLGTGKTPSNSSTSTAPTTVASRKRPLLRRSLPTSDGSEQQRQMIEVGESGKNKGQKLATEAHTLKREKPDVVDDNKLAKNLKNSNLDHADQDKQQKDEDDGFSKRRKPTILISGSGERRLSGGLTEAANQVKNRVPSEAVASITCESPPKPTEPKLEHLSQGSISGIGLNSRAAVGSSLGTGLSSDNSVELAEVACSSSSIQRTVHANHVPSSSSSQTQLPGIEQQGERQLLAFERSAESSGLEKLSRLASERPQQQEQQQQQLATATATNSLPPATSSTATLQTRMSNKNDYPDDQHNNNSNNNQIEQKSLLSDTKCSRFRLAQSSLGPVDSANVLNATTSSGSEPATRGRQNYRHSYCTPSDQVSAVGRNSPSKDPAGSSGISKQLIPGSGKKDQQQQQQQQQSELSTQAKIINILFAGRNSEHPINPHEPEVATKKPLLMPSLLRQYQRRLSNFHQSSNQSNLGSKQATGSNVNGSLNGRLKAQPPEQSAAERSREAARREAGLAAARAAGALASSAASAAQSIISARRQVTRSEVPFASQPIRALPELYALTSEYRHKLDLSQINSSIKLTNQPEASLPQEPSGLFKASYGEIKQPKPSDKQIRHFCANYINNLNLYEINIVDMPTIEPANFPTSSLLEWSQFKGQSHLLTADAYLLVFDLTRPSTIQYIKTLRDKIFESREMSRIPVYVIANKADLCPTLQPSLQERRLRNVAVRHHQEMEQLKQKQEQEQLAAKGAAGSTPHSASNPNLKSADSTIKNEINPKRSSSKWIPYNSTRKRSSDPTSMGRLFVPSAAAHQLLAAYKSHRVRLGSTGPIASLRRWARLRRAFVGPSAAGGIGASAPGFGSHQSAQWMQFERNRVHYSLILGASLGTSAYTSSAALMAGARDSNSWLGVNRIYRRFKSFISFKGRRRDPFDSDATGPSSSYEHSRVRRRRSMAAMVSNSSTMNDRRLISSQSQQRRRRHQRQRRRRRLKRKRQSQAALAGSHNTQTNQSSSNERGFWRFRNWLGTSTQSASSVNERAKMRFRRRQSEHLRSPTSEQQATCVTKSSSGLVGSIRNKLKRKRPAPSELSDSGVSKSESIKSQQGRAARRKQAAERNFRHYSTTLTSAATSTVAKAAAPVTTEGEASLKMDSSERRSSSDNVDNKELSSGAQNEGVDNSLQRKAEHVCGAMSTQANRQTFYELFNTLLQTSSTTVAKSRMRKLCAFRSENTSLKPIDSAKSVDEASNSQQQHLMMPRLEVNSASDTSLVGTPSKSPSGDLGKGGTGKREGRRKSSSTGAALWQTLSSYALSRSSRSSISSAAFGDKKPAGNRRESAATQQAPASVKEDEVGEDKETRLEGRRETQGNFLAEGLLLGTDQYLSVDQLRKLSLISSHSQISTLSQICEPQNGADENPDDRKQSLNQKNNTERSQSAIDSGWAMLRRKSSIRKRDAEGGNCDDLEVCKRPATSTPSAGGKRIWYRGMMKRILFQHSSKPSLKGLISAMEWQKRANELAAAQAAAEANSAGSSTGTSNVRELQICEQLLPVEKDDTQKAEPRASLTTSLEHLAPGTRSRKKSLQVLQSAPSIRITTSGSSLSLLSGGGQAAGSRSVSVSVEMPAQTTRVPVNDENNERKGSENQADCGNHFSGNQFSNSDLPLQTKCKLMEQGDVEALVRSGNDISMEQANSNNTNISCASRLDGSLGSLSDSISLTLEQDKGGSVAGGSSAKGKMMTESSDSLMMQQSCSPSTTVTTRGNRREGRQDKRAHSSQAKLNTCPNNNKDSEDDDDDDDDDDKQDDGGADADNDDDDDDHGGREFQNSNVERDNRRLLGFVLGEPSDSHEAQLQLASCSQIRKLSADDCLIINRHRRQSLAAANIKTGKNNDQDDDDDDDDSWLLVGARDAPGTKSALPLGAAGDKLTANDRCPETSNGKLRDEDVADGARRQSVKASIEAAIHLLVPRAKGSRSASITLGAADCEQRSRSRLGQSIVGAVNVHRTWRDWRQLLTKRKNNQNNPDDPSGSLGDDISARNMLALALAQRNTTAMIYPILQKDNKSNSVNKTENSSKDRQQQVTDGVASPIVSFLSGQSAFNRLSQSEQREAAINFDQLMRINQLTLSAANMVMTQSLPLAATTITKSSVTSDGNIAAGSLGNAISNSTAISSVPALNSSNAEIQLFQSSAIMEPTPPGKKHSRAGGGGGAGNCKNQEPLHQQQQQLMKRLQSSGNLLLSRSVSSNPTPIAMTDSNFSDPSDLSSTTNHHHHHNHHQVDTYRATTNDHRFLSLTASDATNTITISSSLNQSNNNVSAQIASMAARALERQKQRAEALSLILEPRYDKKQPGAQYPLFVSNDLNPILKDLAQLVRKHWRCNYIECSAVTNWNIKPIISELTRTLECNQFHQSPLHQFGPRRNSGSGDDNEGSNLSSSFEDDDVEDDDDDDDDDDGEDYDDDDDFETDDDGEENSYDEDFDSEFSADDQDNCGYLNYDHPKGGRNNETASSSAPGNPPNNNEASSRPASAGIAREHIAAAGAQMEIESASVAGPPPQRLRSASTSTRKVRLGLTFEKMSSNQLVDNRKFSSNIGPTKRRCSGLSQQQHHQHQCSII